MPHGLGYYDAALGGYLPDDPIYTCEKCQETSTDEDFLTEVQGVDLCPYCLEETAQCSDCDDLFFLDDLTEEEGKLFCNDCLAEREQEIPND